MRRCDPCAAVSFAAILGASQSGCSLVSSFDLPAGPASDAMAAGACGDGRLDANEECDDGGSAADDGCSATCTVECDTTDALTYRDARGHCYSFRGTVSGTHIDSKWDAARSDCSLWHGYLASITDGEEQAFVAKILETVGKGAWIGASDLETEGQFQWESGEPWSYENWATDSPDGNGSQNCVFSFGATFEYKWNDYDCEATHPYLCERWPGIPLE